jgi:hypothetical protein
VVVVSDGPPAGTKPLESKNRLIVRLKGTIFSEHSHATVLPFAQQT